MEVVGIAVSMNEQMTSVRQVAPKVWLSLIEERPILRVSRRISTATAVFKAAVLTTFTAAVLAAFTAAAVTKMLRGVFCIRLVTRLTDKRGDHLCMWHAYVAWPCAWVGCMSITRDEYPNHCVPIHMPHAR